MIDSDRRNGLNTALNESALLGVDVKPSDRSAIVWVSALTLDSAGRPPTETVFGLVLTGVTRVVASLREGRWDDQDAAITAFELDQLPPIIAAFGGTPIYGWEFVDPPDESWAHWRNRLSLDVTFAHQDAGHVIELFQEGTTSNRHLDLRIWFTDLSAVRTRAGTPVPLDEFIAGGLRWWDALYAGDPNTAGHGIVPLQGEPKRVPTPHQPNLWQRLRGRGS